ncbi:hypothetical protein BURCENBC7_AP0841 [Burkholderia cenocepacia BC7]|jgi:hypothetical protein|nr:hypothetical protein BURCENK562V_C7106 [Burkholderia cenocepacia K56-2Valvano]ERI28556.1 hypothetical protein BURCENBC7_AP0841 [Burkholderia cenocepacia BC7]
MPLSSIVRAAFRSRIGTAACAVLTAPDDASLVISVADRPAGGAQTQPDDGMSLAESGAGRRIARRGVVWRNAVLIRTGRHS